MQGRSWQEGCPLGLDALVLLRVRHRGYDGKPRDGELIVAREHGPALLRVFARLYAAGFPIEKMRPAHHYGGDDDASMRDNNTSAFNCRPIAGTRTWSRHAFGAALDLNPLHNPYVRGDEVQPATGAPWRERAPVRPGMIVPGGVAVEAFREIGWGWGGSWRSAKDWQHFSDTGD